MTTLAIHDLNVYYGSAHVLQDVSFEVGEEPVAIVGRNGMGKTTLCNTIIGLVPARGGSVKLQGKDLTGATPQHVARSGIAYVPQGRRLFPSLSVDEHFAMLAKGTKGKPGMNPKMRRSAPTVASAPG